MTEALPYATQQFQQTKPATVGFLLGVLGLALICMAGCFLFGILVMYSPETADFAKRAPAGWLLFTAVLYVFAIGCGAGGALVVTQAVKRLLVA